METIESEIPTQQPESPPKQALLPRLLFFALILIVLVQSVFIFYGRNKVHLLQKSQSEVAEKRVQIPDENGFIYTRCYGGSRQPQYCNLYISNLYEPQELLVYTFDFPDVEQTTFEAAFEISILGLADRKAVYQISSWDKIDGTRKDSKSLGFIDLSKGSSTEIYTQEAGNSEAPNRLIDTYLDSINSKLYFTTNARQTLDYNLIQYDLTKQTSTVILDGSTLDFPHVVLGASENEIYLSPMLESPFSEPSWQKTFDLSSGNLSVVDQSKNNAVFDRSGQKVAYVERGEAGENTNLLKLVVSNVDGTDKIAISSVQVPESKIDYPTNFINYYFDLHATKLSYQLRKNTEKSSITESYISILSKSLQSDGQKNIELQLPQASDGYIETMVAQQVAINHYKWADDVIYYQEDSGWYLLPEFHFGSGNDYTINLFGDGKGVIVARAENVFILPN
ncbi:MAG: hypothetical protein O2840_02910 [bacterium]|nr:hypothetical protein [bacterium]